MLTSSPDGRWSHSRAPGTASSWPGSARSMAAHHHGDSASATPCWGSSSTTPTYWRQRWRLTPRTNRWRIRNLTEAAAMTDEIPEVVEEPQFTAADDWPDEDGAQVLTLPSGAVVRVSPPPVVWLALTGRVPANLVAIQKHHIADGKSWTPAELDEALDWLIAE